MTDCSNYINPDDLIAAKEATNHIERVASSPEESVTDSIRGKNVTNLTLNGFENKMEKAILAAGFVLIDSFQQGAQLPNYELTQRNQILRDESTGEYLRWNGPTLPKRVPPGSTPQSTGGNITPEKPMGDWVSVGDAALRTQLAAGDGFGLIGGFNYSGLRAYRGASAKVSVYGREHIFDMASGIFCLDSRDTTSMDDGGVTLIDALGRRWKRIITGGVYPEWWGAAPEVSTGTGQAFQSAIDYCSGRYRKTSNAGLKLSIRGGRWLIDTPLRYTWRDEDNIVDDGDMRRLSVEGDGHCNTYLIYTGPPEFPALSIRGNKGQPNDGVQLRMEMKSFRLWCSLSTPKVGVGIRLDDVAFMTVENVDVGYFNLNWDTIDVIQFIGRDSSCSGANGGFKASISDFSNPNVYSLENWRFSGNINYCVHVKNGANFIILRGSCEGNGNSNAPTDHQTCFFYEGGPAEGGLGLCVEGVYFEGNRVFSDISIENNTGIDGMHVIGKNTFSRTDDVKFSTTHINLSATSTGRMKVIHDGNTYKAFNKYVPSASRPVLIQQTGNILVKEGLNFYTNRIERPNWNGFPAIGAANSQVVLTARVSAEGVLGASWNASKVVRIGVGRYDVYYKYRPESASVIFTGNAAGAIGLCSLGAEYGDRVSVSMTNPAGVLTDMGFTINIMGDMGMSET